MNIISFLEGTVVLNASWDEVRPVAGAPFNAIIELLRNRYSFQSVGTSTTAPQASLMTPFLKAGQFGKESIAQIDFQPANIAVTCSQTITALNLIDDMMEFLRDNLGFRVPPKDRKKTYRSTIISDMGFNVAHTLGKWKEIEILLNKLRGLSDLNMELTGINFIGRNGDRYDPNLRFVFEQRLPAPDGAEWIFSHAPLRTEDHEKLLSKISQLFG
jgi:hypothetical protein